MKTKKILVSILVLTIMCCIDTSAFAGRGGAQGNPTGAGLAHLTDFEIVTLKHMRVKVTKASTTVYVDPILQVS